MPEINKHVPTEELEKKGIKVTKLPPVEFKPHTGAIGKNPEFNKIKIIEKKGIKREVVVDAGRKAKKIVPEDYYQR